MSDNADTGHEQEASQALGKMLRISLMMATQLAQHRAQVRDRRAQELARQARETQAAAQAADRELAAAQSAQQREQQQAARDKAMSERDAAREKAYADRERHQTARRIAEYQLNRVDRESWWDKATPAAIATAYRQAQEWKNESGAAINAGQVIEERVRKDKGLDLSELADQDLSSALAEAYMTPRERAQREKQRRADATRSAGSDDGIAQAAAVSLIKDADREDAQIDAELDSDGGPTRTPELSPVAAQAREEIRALLAKKTQPPTPGLGTTASPLLQPLNEQVEKVPAEHDNELELEVEVDRALNLQAPPEASRDNSNDADVPLTLPNPVTGHSTDSTVAQLTQAATTGTALEAAELVAQQRPAAYDSDERRVATEAWLRDNTTASEEAIGSRMSADLSSAHPPAASVGAAAARSGKANRTGQVRNLNPTHNKQQHQSR